jgi:hypothetical protein
MKEIGKGICFAYTHSRKTDGNVSIVGYCGVIRGFHNQYHVYSEGHEIMARHGEEPFLAINDGPAVKAEFNVGRGGSRLTKLNGETCTVRGMEVNHAGTLAVSLTEEHRGGIEGCATFANEIDRVLDELKG